MKSEEVNSKNQTEDTMADENNKEEQKEEVTELEEILESVPKEEKHEIIKMVRMSMQMGKVLSPEMEIVKKLTPEHVTEYLKTQREAMVNHFKESKENKFFALFTLIIVLIFVVVLVVLLKDKPDVMEKVLYALGGLITGALGGYGLGKSKKEE